MGFSFLFLTLDIVQAADLGRHGAVFPIKEEGFLDMIAARLTSVDIEAEQKKMTEIARRRIAEPREIPGISRARIARSFFFDPSYLLKKDVYLPGGKLLYAAGTKVNPLEHGDFDLRLIFVNAKDEDTLVFLLGLNLGNRDRVILTAGRPVELEEKLGHPVYFDQAGEMTQKFGIKAVPAIVAKEGKMLKISEVPLK